MHELAIRRDPFRPVTTDEVDEWRPEEALDGVLSAADRVDETSESSFPASDPPAVWTWDPAERTNRAANSKGQDHALPFLR